MWSKVTQVLAIMALLLGLARHPHRGIKMSEIRTHGAAPCGIDRGGSST